VLFSLERAEGNLNQAAAVVGGWVLVAFNSSYLHRWQCAGCAVRENESGTWSFGLTSYLFLLICQVEGLIRLLHDGPVTRVSVPPDAAYNTPRTQNPRKLLTLQLYVDSWDS
jgi:hypothetical protein